MHWITTQIDEQLASRLSSELGVSRIIATMLCRLGLHDVEKASRFLRPRLRDLDDPFALTNMDKVVTRLRQALSTKEEVIVFGDYDVDGVTSTTFLVSVLRAFGLAPRYLVPLRMEEGYGLSKAAIDRALEGGVPSLLIAVDCGTNSREEVAYLRSKGVDVIIIDHHTSKESLPEDCVMVNPHVYDGEDMPWSHLCSVGLVFKVTHALIKQLREEGDEQALKIDLKDYLDLVAMGTIADLVPLHQENRIFARDGLQRLQNTRRVGLSALFEACGMKLGEEVSPFDVSFKLGPRINASGRLADAAVPIELLLSDDWSTCSETASRLNDYNRERQEIEREIFLEAEAIVENQLRDEPGFVLYNKDWHPGVVGIVASRIVQKYHRPAIVLGSEGSFARGSGRSIPGVDLVRVLNNCTEFLAHWGGHPMAVGVSLIPDSMELFQKAFSAGILGNVAGGDMPEKEIEIVTWLEPYELGEGLLEELSVLHPYGQANPEPIFGVRNVYLKQSPIPFGNGHFRFFIESQPGKRIYGVAWKMADSIPPVGVPIQLAVRLSWNCFNGKRYPQIELVDWIRE